MRRLIPVLLMFGLPMILGATTSTPPYKNPSEPISVRVKDLMSRMTSEEKSNLLAGTGFATLPNERLGIPALKMTDGALGVRWQRSTAFPAGIASAASFDRDLMRKVSGAIGQEARAKGRDMILGPCVGISRMPFGGRNFEGMGEDPFLTGEMVTSYVQGLNDQNVVGSVKHFALNDQETNRMTIDSVADERTMEEIHLVAFHRAIDAGVGTVMASYNLVNGSHASENADLLLNILRQQFGFTGFVISDWGATHSTIPAALAGLDLEMPTPQYFGDPLLAAVKAKQVPRDIFDDKVARVLTQIFKAGLFDGADTNRPPLSVVNDQEHQDIALQMAREAHVLLQNKNHVLPLNLDQIHNIAVIGPNGGIARNSGGGSSEVQTDTMISLVQALRDRFGARANISYSLGVQLPVNVSAIEAPVLAPAKGEGNGLYAEYFNNMTLTGTPVITRVDPTINYNWDTETSPDPTLGFTGYSARWTGTLTAPLTGAFKIQTNSDDGVRLWVDGSLVIDDWSDHGPTVDTASINFEAGKSYNIKLEYYQDGGNATMQLGWLPPQQPMFDDAVKLAAKSDAVILAMGFNDELESEGLDRATFSLPKGQDALIEAVTKVNPRTVLVINTGNPVDMSKWIDKVQAIIYAWYPGEEGTYALADILDGDVNPSGRLPVTMLRHWKESPAYGTYPGVNGQVDYKEGIFVGYRYFDKSTVPTNFPFGHGLSYTTFQYDNMSIKALNDSSATPQFEIEVTVTNTGHVAGTEVSQLYVHDEAPSLPRPMQELKGFGRIDLQPGESKRVKFLLDASSFAFYDVTTHAWKTLPGSFTVRVGSSSHDIRVTGELELKDKTSVGPGV